ncbi:ABC transporter ATP-binding protein [Petrotoga sp. 9PWA.NaAc.5.4]|uniref:ABC transporter ATP-binding protein n=1 Tax=Petrotoga sp. 9PWA.NaAc.5.4 TaxID=1434328 RepID=UPI000CBA1DB1|nr:ABC transporter ATP-binding protein [Petrotoga sp. 9PWA.NaAc.5.4]PNR96305.1 peptide ABC transporter ATPase [Petrotoga sp. 9PWA.NaAc.5.4]
MLEIKNLKVYYKSDGNTIKAVDDVSFKIKDGETLGLVGESGCGKSTLGQALMKILPLNAQLYGEIIINGKNIVNFNEKQMRELRGRDITMIFQDPMTSLNPIMKVKDLFIEIVQSHFPQISTKKAMEMGAAVLKEVGIEPSRMNQYTFQFSGGMRQRVMIALGLVLKPSFVIADEPTTSLDVIVQAQIIELIKRLRNEYQMSMLLITHDLGVVAQLADKIGVMYAGKLVEMSSKENIYYKPKHPYTKALLKSIPNTNINDKELKYIPGNTPDLANPPSGCKFSPRCEFAMSICQEKEPSNFFVEESTVNCWLFEKHNDLEKNVGDSSVR